MQCCTTFETPTLPPPPPHPVPPSIRKLEEPERRHDTCIEFTVWGYPHPRLRWFHREQEVPPSEYVLTEMEVYQDFLEGCLTFKDPTHHNNGNYTLEASNPLGVATRTVYGHFLDKPFEGRGGGGVVENTSHCYEMMKMGNDYGLI